MPYQDEGMQDQPWVEAGRVMFYKNVWLPCLNFIEFHFFCLIVRTRGFFQGLVNPRFIASHQSQSRRYIGRRSMHGETSRPEIQDWERGGTLVPTVVDSSDTYLVAYR